MDIKTTKKPYRILPLVCVYCALERWEWEFLYRMIREVSDV
jgi:hypothetical protein